MTAFDSPFLFLRHPNGGVEDLDRMKAAGFAGVFCNVGDHPAESWEAVVRPRALSLGMYCGPWLHTRNAADGSFAIPRLEALTATARRWGSPVIVNTEKEIDGTGSAFTELIAEETEGLDAAISMEAWLFNPPSVDWRPVAHLPMLLQIFPAESNAATDPAGCKEHAHDCGFRCVYFTFGTYATQAPATYKLQAPYSLYTADDCGGDYGAWTPTSEGFTACLDDGEDDMDVIGTQDGINAAVDRLISLDPSGSKPNRNPDDMATWGAYDKLRRTLQILKDDHDAEASAT